MLAHSSRTSRSGGSSGLPVSVRALVGGGDDLLDERREERLQAALLVRGRAEVGVWRPPSRSRSARRSRRQGGGEHAGVGVGDRGRSRRWCRCSDVSARRGCGSPRTQCARLGVPSRLEPAERPRRRPGVSIHRMHVGHRLAGDRGGEQDRREELRGGRVPEVGVLEAGALGRAAPTSHAATRCAPCQVGAVARAASSRRCGTPVPFRSGRRRDVSPAIRRARRCVSRRRSVLTDVATTGPCHSRIAGIGEAGRLPGLGRADHDHRLPRLGRDELPVDAAEASGGRAPARRRGAAEVARRAQRAARPARRAARRPAPDEQHDAGERPAATSSGERRVEPERRRGSADARRAATRARGRRGGAGSARARRPISAAPTRGQAPPKTRPESSPVAQSTHADADQPPRARRAQRVSSGCVRRSSAGQCGAGRSPLHRRGSGRPCARRCRRARARTARGGAGRGTSAARPSRAPSRGGGGAGARPRCR